MKNNEKSEDFSRLASHLPFRIWCADSFHLLMFGVCGSSEQIFCSNDPHTLIPDNRVTCKLPKKERHAIRNYPPFCLARHGHFVYDNSMNCGEFAYSNGDRGVV